MSSIFVAAVAVAVFVMYFRHESQLRRKRREAGALGAEAGSEGGPPGDSSSRPDTEQNEPQSSGRS